MNFPTDYDSIIERMEGIRPDKYVRNRNFIDGDVTYLSPYISRGVISTKQVLESVIERGFEPYKIEKFVQELAWRDYWQRIWQAKGDAINEDFKSPQQNVDHHQISKGIVDAKTGINAIDSAINELKSTGYMHNHNRMYTAALACNFGRNHWKMPAKWMYYHLLDADWASNALSWQWVAGSNSGKKYVANQENINRYTHDNQHGTYLDRPYSDFDEMEVPEELSEVIALELKTDLPKTEKINLDESLPTFIYTHYNLDPIWHKEETGNRILLLEPSHFEQFPMSPKSIEFILGLSKNIEGIQLFVGEFDELKNQLNSSKIYFKEHHFSQHFEGEEESRDWICDVDGYHSSFFQYWKKCKSKIGY